MVAFSVVGMTESIGETGAAAPPRRSFAVDPDSPAGVALAQLDAAVDTLFALDPLSLNDTELLGVLDGIDRATRRMPAARDPHLAEALTRGIPRRLGDRTTSAFLRRRWQLSAGEAHTWAEGAELFAPQRSLSSGEVLPSRLPILGAARAEGRVSAMQTRIITDLLHRLPACVDSDDRRKAEAIMVAEAKHRDPDRLARSGQRLLDLLDPDGHYKDPDEVKKRRGLSLGREKDGLTPLTGQLDAWTAAALRSVLEPLANPTRATRDGDGGDPGDSNDRQAGTSDAAHPGDGCQHGTPADTRTTPQRLHDALREALEMLLGSDGLPKQGGLPATILVVTTLADLEARTGYASTAHGGLVPVADVIRHATKAKIVDIVVDDLGNPLFLGRARRLASLQQRLALIARDRGCVIPHCDVPATRTEVHHLIPWAGGGRTDVDSMTLLCGHHHDRVEDWILKLHNGRVSCTAPPWIDPSQTPAVNDYFHDPPLFDVLE